MVFAWLGLLGHMRVFSRYRLLLKALQSSAWYLVPFIMLTVVILWGFSVSYTYYETGYFSFDNFSDQMEMQHRIFLGDFNDFFNTVDEDKFNFALFVMLTIIEPLIMLNLLIALVSVVYNELMS